MSFRFPLPSLTRRRWLVAVGASLALAACAPMATAPSGADPLPSWNEGANKQRIVDFVKAVSSEGGKDYVAPADRIAVFDNDGTLWLEYPLYTQIKFDLERARSLAPQHPEWKDQEPFKSLLAGDMKGVMAGGEKSLVQIVLAAQSGNSTTAFGAAANDWVSRTQDPRFKRPYDQLTYQPMQELLRYLRANGFRTYISSGLSAEFMRPFGERVYGIPPEQVIGTRQKLAYEFKDGSAQLVMQPQIEHVNDGPGKPVGIEVLIGKRPIAAFGNSDGDLAMLQYTTTGPGRTLGMIVHHDDAQREYAYDRESSVGKLDKGLDQYRAAGWGLISMKNDWKAVFAPPK